jgi:LmbE family N-acetylglucosaminyl deacetylase
MRPGPGRVGGARILVLSPHLDDGVFSIGAFIASAVADGAHVTILTIFGGDPDSAEKAGRWDLRAGFGTAGEAARRRREEDRAACGRLGAIPEWLPFADKEYAAARNAEEIWDRLAPQLQRANLVFTPGRPLIHPDHAWLAELVSRRFTDWSKLVAYAELPYDAWPNKEKVRRATVGELAAGRTWVAPQVSVRARLAKWRSTGAYSSQLPWLTRGARYRQAVLKARLGHERIAWPRA